MKICAPAADRRAEDSANAEELQSSLSIQRVDVEDNDPDQPSKRLRQTLITPDMLVPVIRQSVAECMAQCFAVNALPMVLADSEYFHRLLYAFRQSHEPPPSRRELPQQFYEGAKRIRSRVINALRQAAGVTVGIDGWTNVKRQKVINLVGVANGVAYYWDSLVLKDRSTAEAQLKPVGSGLKSIMAQGVIVVGLVTDNEEVNYKLYKLLSEKLFSYLVHIPCAAHTIQLCVKYVLALTHIVIICDGLDAMIKAFCDCKELRIALSQMQQNIRKGEIELSLIKHNATRWSSRLRAAERVIRLNDCLVPLVPQILANLAKSKDTTLRAHKFDAPWWDALKALVGFLKPFQVATDVVQSDTSTLMDVYIQLLQLVEHLEALDTSHLFANAVPQMRKIIRLQWDKHINVNAVIMCATFAFDNNYATLFTADTLDHAISWFIKWGANFVKQYGMSDETDELIITATLMQQLSNMKAGISPFAALTSRKQMLELAAGRQRWDPRGLWALYKDSVPELASCALALLSLTASEAAVERTFSMQGSMHTKKRNRMSADLVQSQMFIAFNERALQKDGKQDDDDAEVELSRSYQSVTHTTNLFHSHLTDDSICPAPEVLEDMSTVTSLATPDMEVDESNDETDVEHNDVYHNDANVMMETSTETEDPIVMFVKEYVRAHCITHRFRWGGDAMNALQSALISKHITLTMDDMRDKIKTFVQPVDTMI